MAAKPRAPPRPRLTRGPGHRARRETAMAQKDVEVILMRQLASYLAMPIFLVDPTGNLLFYNEPAEALLGRRYDETGEMPLEEWSAIFVPVDESGAPLPPEALPLAVDAMPTIGRLSGLPPIEP